jgi:hypothetical protein
MRGNMFGQYRTVVIPIPHASKGGTLLKNNVENGVLVYGIKADIMMLLLLNE